VTTVKHRLTRSLAVPRVNTVPGLMAAIYGTPEHPDGDVIELGQASSARLFPQGSYSTGRLDDGREGARDGSTAR
jgi:hypothetical protein